MSKKRGILLFVVLISVLLLSIFNGDIVFAAMVDDKINAYDIWRCVDSSVRTIERDSFTELEALYGSTSEPIITKDGERSDTISCVNLIGRYLSADELTLGTNEMKDIVLKKLGYTNSNSDMCYGVNLEYKILGRTDSWQGGIATDTLCMKNGKINVAEHAPTMSINGNEYDMVWLEYPSDSQIVVKVSTGDATPYTSDPINVNGNLKNAMNEVANIITSNGTKSDFAYVRDAGLNERQMGNNYTRTKSGASVMSDLTDSKFSDVGKTAFSKTEKRDLYEAYLHNYYAVDSICDEESAPSGYVQTVLSGSGKARLCYVKALAHDSDSDTVNALDGGGFFNGTRKNWKQLAAELYEDWKDEIGETVEETENIDDAGESAFEECYNAGVDGISWIVCPAISNMTSTIDGIDATLSALLSIDNAFYENGSVAQDAWRAFRDIANWAMIVILLVIIVSQITGYGIDNYGIKKMLPKLIVMAILVNFSFLICQLAIDVSNIVGAGASEMFENVGGSLSSGLTAGKFISSVATSLIGLAAGVGSSSGIIISLVGIVMNPGVAVMLIIGLALSLVVALVSVLMFFLTVGARGVIVILCAAISPLAFACYILPNTQPIFKTWRKIFGAALLVYPICGAMYGISFVIRAIVFQDGSGVHPLMALVGIMSPFLPFLAMPSLLRGALNAVGNIGGAISNIGGSLRTGLNRGAEAFRNTEAYKDAQSEVALNRQNAMAQRTIDRIRKKMASGGNSSLSATDRRRLAKARSVVLANTARTNKEDNLVSDVGYGAALSSAAMDADNEEYKAYQNVISGYSRTQLADAANSSSSWYDGSRVSQNRMKALIGAMEANGMQNDIYKMLGATNVGNSSKVMQSLANSKDKVLKAYGKRGAGQAYNDFMDNGGMRAYAREKGTDFVHDLDDKSLGEIARHTTSNNQIMDGSTLSVAAATINAQDAVDNIDKLMSNMPRSEINFTPAELVSFNTSTIHTLLRTQDRGVYDKLIAASNQIANNPELNTKLKAPQRSAINHARASRGMQPI